MVSLPRHTGALHLPAPGSFRTLSRSLVEMAALTGVTVRLARSIVLAQDPAPGLGALWAFYVLGAAFVMGMAALHLSNYPVRSWVWRGPAFVAVEVTAEMLVSALLIAMDREPWGTGSAHLHDWPVIAARTLVFRGALLLPFVLVLGAVVQGVRLLLGRRRL